jgi:hypothetical protein
MQNRKGEALKEACIKEAKKGPEGIKKALKANSLRNPISKITRVEWTTGMVQVVECLLCKCETLSSNPKLTGKKKKGEQS